MKKILLFSFLVLGVSSVCLSQKVITKKLDVKGKSAEMKFDFADTIAVEAWNKDYIDLEVSVNIDENHYNDYYALNIDENQAKVEMIEKVDFEAIKKLKGTKNLCNFNSEINYKLKIPANLEFSLKTISGKIVLVGAQGRMSLNSISGFIDYAIPAAAKPHIKLSTVTGEVYSNVKFDQRGSKKMDWVTTKCDLSLNGGEVPMELKTVSGDIFLRKL